MKKNILLVAALALLAAVSCSDLEDVQGRLDELESRVTALETQVNALNSNVEGTVELMEAGTISDATQTGGVWTITLSDGIVLHFKDKIEVSATAYTTEGQDFKITYSGATARYGIIAVDPRVIPLGTEMFVVGTSGMWTYGYCIAGDIGGFIKGNRIDLFYNTENECKNFGRRGAIVYILSGNE